MWKIFQMVKKTAIIVIGITILAAIGLLIVFYDDVSLVFLGQSQILRDELLKVILTSVGGCVVIIALYYAAKYMPALKKYNAGVRFNNAVGHLGSASPTVVLGGIHDLHQIAINNSDYTQLVHNLFCSYIREKSEELYRNNEEVPDKCSVILQQLIDYLFKPYNGRIVYKKFVSDLSHSTLINCDFAGTSINDVNFNNCEIRRCSFKSAALNRVMFNDSILSDVDISKAAFRDVAFYDAAFSDVTFRKSVLKDVDFWVATLTNVGFGNVTFNNIDFYKTTMNNVSFENATLSDVYFNEASLDGLTKQTLETRIIIKEHNP